MSTKSFLVSFLWYILRNYIISTITFFVVVGVGFYVYRYNPENQTPFNYPVLPALYFAVMLPPINLIVYLVLFFYRFNKTEVVCESCLFCFILFDDVVPDILQRSLITISIIFAYVGTKRLIKHLANSNSDSK